MASSSTTLLIVVIVLAVVAAVFLAVLIWLAVSRNEVPAPTNLKLVGQGGPPPSWFVVWQASSSQGNSSGPLLYRYQVVDQQSTVVQSGDGLTDPTFQLLPNGQQPLINTPYGVTVVAYTPTAESTPLTGVVQITVVIPNPPTNLQLIPNLAVVPTETPTCNGAESTCRALNMTLATESDIRSWATVQTNRFCLPMGAYGSDCHGYRVSPASNVCPGQMAGVLRTPDVVPNTLQGFCKPLTASGSVWYVSWTASTSPQPIAYRFTVSQGSTVVQTGSGIADTSFQLLPNNVVPVPNTPYSVSVWASNEQAESMPLTGTVQVPLIPPSPPSNIQLQSSASSSSSFSVLRGFL